jgi:hypothetical protein
MTDKRPWLEPGDLEEDRDAEWRRSLTSYRNEDEISPNAWRGGEVHPPVTNTAGRSIQPSVERFCGPKYQSRKELRDKEQLDAEREEGS